MSTLANLPAFGILAGLVLLLIGAEAVLRGTLGVARRFNVPEQAVGFLVVGLGTSLPELTVAIDAVVQGVPELAAGNALGANFVNLLVVLPVAALFGPLSVPVLMLWMDAPVLLLALVLVFATLSSKAGLTSRRTARFVCV